MYYMQRLEINIPVAVSDKCYALYQKVNCIFKIYLDYTGKYTKTFSVA